MSIVMGDSRVSAKFSLVVNLFCIAVACRCSVHAKKYFTLQYDYFTQIWNRYISSTCYQFLDVGEI